MTGDSPVPVAGTCEHGHGQRGMTVLPVGCTFPSRRLSPAPASGQGGWQPQPSSLLQVRLAPGAPRPRPAFSVFLPKQRGSLLQFL